MKRLLHHLTGLAALTVLMTAQVWAGEYVVLGTGFRLHAERHEVDGGTVRIFSGRGVVEMPATAVASYEQEELAAPVEPPPAQTPTVRQDPAPESKPLTPQELASQAAKKYLLPDTFVQSVMKAESGFHANAVSPKGAIGLMQLMPDTARVLGVDPSDPHQNAEGGAEYLRELLARYESNPDQVLLALAAYNAGPAAVERYHGVPPYPETRQYILRVLKNWKEGADNNANK
jgi:soluble lytic murein transglycosylase-like protein